MRGGTLQYRCRRCGAVILTKHVKDPKGTLSSACVGMRPGSLDLLDIHRCSADAAGIADLVGVELDPE